MSPCYSSLLQNPTNCFISYRYGGMPALAFILFTQKFPISSCRILVWHIYCFCRTDSIGGCPLFSFLLSTAKSPDSFSTYVSFKSTFHMISSLLFPNNFSFSLHLDADIASVLILPEELFAVFLSFLSFLSLTVLTVGILFRKVWLCLLYTFVYCFLFSPDSPISENKILLYSFHSEYKISYIL